MRFDDFPFRRTYAMLAEFLLRSDFIESQPALFNSFASVNNTALFQNLLHLAVFAKSSVQRDERQVYSVRQLERGVSYIDLYDGCAE